MKKQKESNHYQESYDLDFRPSSYFNFEDPISELLTNIKGETRRKWLKNTIQEGILTVPDFLLREGLKDGERNLLGRINPTFMGGEYLPDREEYETEIARIIFDSTTQDVFSIRARYSPTNITYIVVDEYNSIFNCISSNSTEPFTFGQFIQFLDSIYSEEFNSRGIFNICLAGIDPNDFVDLEHLNSYRNFLKGHSEFYPEFQNYVEVELNSWLDECSLNLYGEVVFN